jgi:hypothetical protein
MSDERIESLIAAHAALPGQLETPEVLRERLAEAIAISKGYIARCALLEKKIESAIKGFDAIDGIKAHEGAQCRMAMIAAVHLAELRAV